MRAAEYTGILGDFLGTRWWRVGVEHLLWQWTDGNPFDRKALSAAVSSRLSSDLDLLEMARPVVCVDPDSLRPTDRVIDAADAIQIQPDEWPLYAEQAWLRRDDVAQIQGLSGLIVARDRERSVRGS